MLLIIKNYRSLIALLVICSVFVGCKKYLDAKSNQKLVIPETIQDLQSLLDYYTRVNQFDPSASERSADNYYLTYADWSSLSVEGERRVYIWEKDRLFPTGNSNDWGFTYDNVYRSNVVLSNLDKIERTTNDQDDWNNVKGQALFLRAKSFLQAAFIWALAYDESTSSTELGIPLRLDPDFNQTSVRPNVQETYDRIILDLKEAISLLPNTAIHKIRPAKHAAYALLARTYLSMRKYDSCFKYTDLSLQLYNTLLDYNSLTPSQSFPISRFNDEVLVDSYMQTPNTLVNNRAKIDSSLYQSYSSDDLRKIVFFRANTGSNTGTYSFKGSYTKNLNLFDGIANDEVYLMRAECYARAGNEDSALADLNTLMKNRWKTVTWVPFTANDSNDALNKILIERRKELLMRGLRWMDIKRLNKEGANISLQRIMNGQTYTLPPNDLRFALAIPEDVILLSGMQQNIR